ncbi:MAG: lipoyl synthase [bacterium]|nr:lipoyl synthase [bacterium]
MSLNAVSTRLPHWLIKKIYRNEASLETKEILKSLKLNTVCESARCPNMWECFSKRRATFMILGDICSRDCSFCSVKKGVPRDVDESESAGIAEAVGRMNLKHVVITSVTRDDLEDGGSSHFARTVSMLKKRYPEVLVEVLTPDFQGKVDCIKRVAESGPDIFNHNIETVKRLYEYVRPRADYYRSLDFLGFIKTNYSGIYTKSGLMVGLGETGRELESVFDDLRSAGCDILTVGQYLSPSKNNIPVAEYVHPDVFKDLENIAFAKGFLYVMSGPFVRSSYNADQVFDKIKNKDKTEV